MEIADQAGAPGNVPGTAWTGTDGLNHQPMERERYPAKQRGFPNAEAAPRDWPWSRSAFIPHHTRWMDRRLPIVE